MALGGYFISIPELQLGLATVVPHVWGLSPQAVLPGSQGRPAVDAVATPLLQMVPWAFTFVKNLLRGSLPTPPASDMLWNKTPTTSKGALGMM